MTPAEQSAAVTAAIAWWGYQWAESDESLEVVDELPSSLVPIPSIPFEKKI